MDAPGTTGEPDDDGNLASTPQEPMAWTADIEAWGADEAAESYAGMWVVDGSRMAVAFANDVERWAEELHERFHPGFGIAEADHTIVELRGVQDELVTSEMSDGWDGDDPPEGTIVGAGYRATINRVTVSVFAPDDARLAELSDRYGADLLCFEDSDVPQTLLG